MKLADFQHIALARYQLNIEALEPLVLPDDKGLTFRGGFGHAFKAVSCTAPENTCQECSLKKTCAYAYVFETLPPKDTTIMQKYPSAPHPFVLLPPLEERNAYEPGNELSFS